jgi:hypothetical protein
MAMERANGSARINDDMKQLRAERHPAWLPQQHGLNGETAINLMTAALDAIAKAATTGEPMNAPTSQTQR